jgi:hypothetical protein
VGTGWWRRLLLRRRVVGAGPMHRPRSGRFREFQIILRVDLLEHGLRCFLRGCTRGRRSWWRGRHRHLVGQLEHVSVRQRRCVEDELMTRSRLVDPAWSYPIFEALALKFFVGEILFALASRPSLLRLRTPSAFVGKLPIGRLWSHLRDRCSRQPATVSPVRLGLALLHLSGHRSVI